jgi:hypothetical protein
VGTTTNDVTPRQRPRDQPVKRLILGAGDFQPRAIDWQQDLRSPRHGNGFRNVRCHFAKGAADVDETVTSLTLVLPGPQAHPSHQSPAGRGHGQLAVFHALHTD